MTFRNQCLKANKQLLIISLFLIISFVKESVLEDIAHREKRQIGGMYAGGQGSNLGPGGGVQGIQNFQAGDGIQNPTRPQLESIYRGKVIWGNVSEDQLNKEEDRLINNQIPVQPGYDPYGNPMEPSPDEIRRRPRPRIKPKRKEVDEFTMKREKRDVKKTENYDLMNKEGLDNERKKRDLENTINENYVNMAQNIYNSKLEAQNKVGPIESIYKGPRIESIYKGPQIQSLYKGPQILSMYTGPQIKSQYEGAPIRSQYLGPPIQSIYGAKIDTAKKAEPCGVRMIPENMAMKYERMNEENNMVPRPQRARLAPALQRNFE